MISVIVPMYNARKYLRECLDSLANQTYKDLEVLMVNDGSTDDTGEIAREYEEKYPNFYLINKENGGQMSAWLLGIQYAKGDYFGFVDSDDYVAPTMYEEMVATMEQTGADVVMCNFYDVDRVFATPRSVALKPYYGEDSISEIHDLVFPTMTSYISVSRWDKLFRRDLYMENAEKYCDYVARTFEDRFIVTPYLFSCKSFAFVEKPLYYWRQLKVSSSRKPRPELCDIMENLYARQKKMLQDRGLYGQYRDNLEIGKIDLMRAIIGRNLGGKIPYQDKIKIAGRILTEENRKIVLSHKTACVGKFGKYIYTACRLNSKALMVAGAVLMKKLAKENNENAFD